MQTFDDVLSKKFADSRRSLTSSVTRLDKQVRTLEPRIVLTEKSLEENDNLMKSSLDELKLQIRTFTSGLDDLKADLQLVNTSQIRLKGFIDNEKKNASIVYKR